MSEPRVEDERFLRRALRLGLRGLGRTSPNPPVGAVVVRDGRVVGRGYHRGAGQPHAEAEALRNAGELARGATLYVTLEPCSHYGRTPPCTEAILRAGIRRVVFGSRDPNPASGQGRRVLRRGGVEVVEGVLEGPCRALLAPFAKAVERGLPWLTLKLAASADGRIATSTGDSRWVSSAESRSLVHHWRDTHDAVLVGANTVLRDDPLLTCRKPGGRNPWRVVVDGRLRVPLGAKIFGPVLAKGSLVFTTPRASPEKVSALRRRGVQVIVVPARRGTPKLRSVLRRLVRLGVHSVLLEGGAELATQAVRERLVDAVRFFYAPKLVGGDGTPMLGKLGVRRMGRAVRLFAVRYRRVGPDCLLEATLENGTPEWPGLGIGP
ncbi:MAG: riboflavin biosynthesis protein RibD [Candidatus Binatia bacterium]|nr:MAG: riboflavin biosynthesis protein RibD [Candidatus Binatia bacterium]